MSSTKSGMQALLNVVNNYTTTWKLNYNATMSNCMVFRSSTVNANQPDLEFMQGEIRIPNKKSVTYAGTLIDSNLNTLEKRKLSVKKLK